MRVDLSPRRRWHRTSVRAKAAVGAGLASLAAFGLATFWVSSTVHGQWMADVEARAQLDAATVAEDIPLGRDSWGLKDTTGESVLLVLEDGRIVQPVQSQEGQVHLREGQVYLPNGRWFWQNTLLAEYLGTPAVPFADLSPFTPTVSPELAESLKVRLPEQTRSPHSLSNGPALGGRTVTLMKRVTVAASPEALERYTGISGLAEQRVTVYLLANPTPADRAAARITGIFRTWVIPGATLFTALVAWWVTGLALRPVEGIRRRMARIGDGAFHERVPVPPAGDGISRLAVTTNVTLDRLEHALKEQRRLVSDASHELRSPLAALRSSLEIPLAHPAGADWPQVVTGALADTERLQLLTDDLLLLAAADEQQRSGPAEPVDLADVVAEQLAERVHLAGADGPAWAATVSEPTPVRGGEILLGRLVRNLLDNAGRYARGTVAVSVAVADGRAVLTVADDGPGIAPADRERVFDRFVRLDDARDRTTGGSGLGLSLVRSIVHNLGGTVAFTDPPLGAGARVVVRLPLSG